MENQYNYYENNNNKYIDFYIDKTNIIEYNQFSYYEKQGEVIIVWILEIT